MVGATNDQASRYQAVIDMKARTYIPGLAMFAQVDPLADEMPAYSPYAYGFNDPVNFTDPTGMAPTGFSETTWGSTTAGASTSSDCPPGVDCDGSADNRGYVRDPSDNEASRDFGMYLARAAFYFLDAVGLNAVDNAVADYNEAEGSLQTTRALVSGTGALLTLGTRGKGGAGKGASGVGIKQIGPAGDAGATVARQIPANWTVRPAKHKGTGTRWADPVNPKGNNVRVMRGNPNSKHPSQRVNYVRETRNGATVNRNGNPVPHNSPDSHIPLIDWFLRY